MGQTIKQTVPNIYNKYRQFNEDPDIRTLALAGMASIWMIAVLLLTEYVGLVVSEDCLDKDPECANMIKRCLVVGQVDMMNEICPLTCSVCKPTPGSATTVNPGGNPQNPGNGNNNNGTNGDCADDADASCTLSLCNAEGYEHIMKHYCAKSCGFCVKPTEDCLDHPEATCLPRLCQLADYKDLMLR